MTGVKICGIKTHGALNAAAEAGASHLGFVFYPDSPRYIAAKDAKKLCSKAPKNICNTGLFVNATAPQIAAAIDGIKIDMLQLHGDETPDAVRLIKQACGLPVMKAIRIAKKDDLHQIRQYQTICDWLLFDTKTSAGRGGTGECFDWSILAGQNMEKPWMLAGGLHIGNVNNALAILNPDAVDVSSGVEDSPGIKNPARIKEFIAAVQQKG